LVGLPNEVRCLGIVADGPTDQDIMAVFLKVLLEPLGPCKEIILGQRLSPLVSQFRQQASRTDQYGLFDQPVAVLEKGIVSLIHAAVSELRDQAGRELIDSDLLLLSTDAEDPVRDSSDVYRLQRTTSILLAFDLAIAEFYNSAANPYCWRWLPLVIPLVLFPSTDVIVAAARPRSSPEVRLRGVRANDLKKRLYGCSDLSQLSEEDFSEKALGHLTPSACERIYSALPEARFLLRTLTWSYGAGKLVSQNVRCPSGLRDPS